MNALNSCKENFWSERRMPSLNSTSEKYQEDRPADTQMHLLQKPHAFKKIRIISTVLKLH